MAMSVITAATTEGAATAFTLSGPTRISADLTGNQVAVLYEERPSGDYEPVEPSVQLTSSKRSILYEGYGSHKVVISEAGIDVGYAA